jgi:hypothetical protein
MMYAEGRDQRWARAPSHRAGAARGLATPPWRVGPPWLLSTPPFGFLSLLGKYNFWYFSRIFLIFKIWSLDGPFFSRILTLAATPPTIIKHVKAKEIT